MEPVAQGDLTTTSYVVLGMLVSRDLTAYDISELFGRGVGELWPRAGRQHYNAPKKLLERGLVTARADAVGARPRTVYSITDEGRAALTAWLAERSRPSALEFEGMMRVLFADQGSIEDLRSNLRTMREQADATRRLFGRHAVTLRDTTVATFPERQHLMALANRFMVGHFSHIVEWSDWALAEIEDWPDTTTPATSHRDRTETMLDASARLGAPEVHEES